MFVFVFHLVMVMWQYDTIDAVLQRGEKLDDIVKKSDDLSIASKAFYKEVLV